MRRWLYPGLAAWSAVWFAALAGHGGISWKFFTTGTSLLFGGHPAVIAGITGGPGTAGPAGLPGPPPPGGLHLLANYPALQIGPVAYLVTGLIRHLSPGNGLVAAQVLLEATGLLIVWLIGRIASVVRPPSLAGDRTRASDRTRAGDWTLLAGGAVFLVAWTELAVAFTHLDDGLALLLATAAVYATITGRPVLAGVAIGLAAGAKPWALVFLPVTLIPAQQAPADGDSRRRAGRRLTALGTAVLTAAACYLPFLIADPGSQNATRFLIRNEPMSALRALGVTENYTPRWDRPAQILLGWALGALAVARRRWPAVLLLAGGARIVLDPAAHSYYTPDIVTGALLWDMLGNRRPFPLWTAVTFTALNLVPHFVSSQAAQGSIRLALVAAVTVAVLFPPAAANRSDELGTG